MRKGQSLIELLIIIALTSAILPPLIMTLMASRDGKVQQDKRLEAAMLLKETQEAVRLVRENGWSSISTPGIYHPVLSGSTWTLSSGADTVNGLTRQLEVFNVNRLNSQIVTSGGTFDPSTKRIVITISWNDPLSTSLSSTMYITRYLENATYMQTLKSEFDTGILTDAITTANDGGEVTLGAGGAGSWCQPALAIAALDLPKNGVANALTAIEGKAFAATGDNASGVSMASINLSNTSPPVATIQNTFDGYKTNDIFGDTQYAYLATDNNGEEIVIVNTSTNTKTGYFNASGSGSGDSIYVTNNRGYMAQGSTFRIFDLSSKSGSRSQLGSIALSGTGTSIAVVGNYAYVTTTSSSRELQIIDVSNPNSPSIVGYADINASGGGRDVSINDTATRAYVVTGSSSTQNELFIVNISTKTGARTTVSSYNSNAMDPQAVTLAPGNIAIIVGRNGEEYQVINIANESNPIRCGGIEINTGINDIASVLESDGDAYSYIVTGDSSTELKIIEGGPGGQYSSSGIYQSATFDLGYATAFNRIIPTFTEPVNTTVRMRIAIADAVSGSCTSANYVYTGPDGTTNTYYSGIEPIFFNDDNSGYENPGRCMRYRVYLDTTDSNSTPIFEEITINYSP